MSLFSGAVFSVLAGLFVGWVLSRWNPHLLIIASVIFAISMLVFGGAGHLAGQAAEQGTRSVMEVRGERPGEGLALVPGKVAVGTYAILTLPIRVFLFAVLLTILWITGIFLGIFVERRGVRMRKARS